MTQPTNTDLADALREIANTLPLGSALVVRLAADRLGVDADGWIEWSAMTCSNMAGPVSAGTLTRVRFRNGKEHEDSTPHLWSWHEVGDTTITHYRPVK